MGFSAANAGSTSEKLMRIKLPLVSFSHYQI